MQSHHKNTLLNELNDHIYHFYGAKGNKISKPHEWSLNLQFCSANFEFCPSIFGTCWICLCFLANVTKKSQTDMKEVFRLIFVSIYLHASVQGLELFKLFQTREIFVTQFCELVIWRKTVCSLNILKGWASRHPPVPIYLHQNFCIHLLSLLMTQMTKVLYLKISQFKILEICLLPGCRSTHPGQLWTHLSPEIE